MSEPILPPGITIPQPEEKAAQLPEPKGYKLLCIVPDVSETIDGTNLFKASDVIRREEQTTTVLFVAKVGEGAYKDQSRCPGEPWCKEGDFVMVRTYAGTRFKMYGKEMRYINDDQVEGVVQDPRGISHVWI